MFSKNVWYHLGDQHRPNKKWHLQDGHSFANGRDGVLGAKRQKLVGFGIKGTAKAHRSPSRQCRNQLPADFDVEIGPLTAKFPGGRVRLKMRISQGKTFELTPQVSSDVSDCSRNLKPIGLFFKYSSAWKHPSQRSPK